MLSKFLGLEVFGGAEAAVSRARVKKHLDVLSVDVETF